MAQLNTSCPVCGAPHARKLSVIHSEGFSTVQTDINTVGTFNTIGRQKIKTKGTATGIQQTQASKDAAPPVVPELMTTGTKIRAAVICLGIIMCAGGFLNDSTAVAICGVFVILGAFAVPTKATEAEQQDYDDRTRHLRVARDAWSDTFQCGACRHRFVPVEAKTA